MKKTKTKAQQKADLERKLIVAVGLEAHLRALAGEILTGKPTVQDFDDFLALLQYAPISMRERLLNFLEALKSAPTAAPAAPAEPPTPPAKEKKATTIKKEKPAAPAAPATPAVT